MSTDSTAQAEDLPGAGPSGIAGDVGASRLPPDQGAFAFAQIGSAVWELSAWGVLLGIVLAGLLANLLGQG